MSRTNRHQLLVSQEQYDWIARSVTRKNDQAKNVGETNKRLLSEMALLADKFLNAPELIGDRCLLPTTRNELRILEQIAENERAALADQVAPSYEARGLANYAATARKKAANLAALLTVIRKALA